MSESSGKSLVEVADAAFAEVAKSVIQRAIDTGTPVIVWKDGAVVELDPHELKVTRQKSANPVVNGTSDA